MSRDHIIPRFILRGFAINPSVNKKNQKIKIYNKDNGDVVTQKIDDAFAIVDFNSPETEKFLADNYENDMANIFRKIRECIQNNSKSFILSSKEYKLLFRFVTIMWRRNDIQVDKLKEMSNGIENFIKLLFGENYKNMIKPEYQDKSFEEYFDDNIDIISKHFYDTIIQNTDDNDETVLKTIKNYYPCVIYNTSKTHFILHNTYGTMQYMIKQNTKVEITDYPYNMIYPISRELCLCLFISKKQIDLDKNEYEIRIEEWNNDEDVKRFLINNYITPTAKYFVVDDTNGEIVKEYLNKKEGTN